MIFLFDLFALVFIFIGWPGIIVFGWVRWTHRDKERSAVSRISAAGHLLGSLALVLALGSAICSFSLSSSPGWDLRLIRICKWGILSSLGGLLLGAVGIFRPGPLRWLAPLGSLSSLLFWLAAAASY